MREFTIDRGALRTFHDDPLQSSLTTLELLRRSARNADVPSDAYTRTGAGEIAHRGHTENLHALDGLIDDLHAAITDFARRAEHNTGNYEAAEDMSARSARRVQA
jgi:hypothetical protein